MPAEEYTSVTKEINLNAPLKPKYMAAYKGLCWRINRIFKSLGYYINFEVTEETLDNGKKRSKLTYKASSEQGAELAEAIFGNFTESNRHGFLGRKLKDKSVKSPFVRWLEETIKHTNRTPLFRQSTLFDESLTNQLEWIDSINAKIWEERHLETEPHEITAVLPLPYTAEAKGALLNDANILCCRVNAELRVTPQNFLLLQNPGSEETVKWYPSKLSFFARENEEGKIEICTIDENEHKADLPAHYKERIQNIFEVIETRIRQYGGNLHYTLRTYGTILGRMVTQSTNLRPTLNPLYPLELSFQTRAHELSPQRVADTLEAKQFEHISYSLRMYDQDKRSVRLPGANIYNLAQINKALYDRDIGIFVASTTVRHLAIYSGYSNTPFLDALIKTDADNPRQTQLNLHIYNNYVEPLLIDLVKLSKKKQTPTVEAETAKLLATFNRHITSAKNLEERGYILEGVHRNRFKFFETKGSKVRRRSEKLDTSTIAALKAYAQEHETAIKEALVNKDFAIIFGEENSFVALHSKETVSDAQFAATEEYLGKLIRHVKKPGKYSEPALPDLDAIAAEESRAEEAPETTYHYPAPYAHLAGTGDLYKQKLFSYTTTDMEDVGITQMVSRYYGIFREMNETLSKQQAGFAFKVAHNNGELSVYVVYKESEKDRVLQTLEQNESDLQEVISDISAPFPEEPQQYRQVYKILEKDGKKLASKLVKTYKKVTKEERHQPHTHDAAPQPREEASIFTGDSSTGSPLPAFEEPSTMLDQKDLSNSPGIRLGEAEILPLPRERGKGNGHTRTPSSSSSSLFI